MLARLELRDPAGVSFFLKSNILLGDTVVITISPQPFKNLQEVFL